MSGAGIGGNGVIAGNQGIGLARRPFVQPIAPLLAGLTHQPIDDIERRVEDAAQVGQHIGHAHQVVIVGPGVTPGLAGHQAKEIFQAQSDAHESVIFHFGHRDEFVDLHRVLGQQVLIEHLPAARHRIGPGGRFCAVDVGDVEFAQHRQHGGGRLGIGALVHSVITHVRAHQRGTGFLAQEAQHRPGYLLADQLLQQPFVVHPSCPRLVLIEFDADALGFAKFFPHPLQRRRRPFEGPVNFFVAGLVIALHRPHAIIECRSIQSPFLIGEDPAVGRGN